LIPHRARDDLRRVGAVAVLVGDVANLLEQALGERRGVKSERDEAVAADVELVLHGLLAGVRQVRDLHAGLLGDQFGEFTHAVVSVTWLKTLTWSPRVGGFSKAIWMHRTVSRIWIKARVCPPVPCTVNG